MCKSCSKSRLWNNKLTNNKNIFGKTNYGVIEIEIWHCFNSVKGRRNICGVSWNCLVVSSPPFLIEVENPLLGRMMPPTSSLYHYGIVSHHSQKLAKITVYFFFLHQWRVGSLNTVFENHPKCLISKFTWKISIFLSNTIWICRPKWPKLQL